MREIIEVNGVKYDAITGLKIEQQASEKDDLSYFSYDIHSNLQKSNTLNRKFVTRPEKLTSRQNHAIEQFKKRHDYAEIRRSAVVKTGEISHAQISKFDGVRGSASRVISPISSPKQIIHKNTKNEDEKISPAEIHPIQQRAIEKMREQKLEKTLPSAKEIKDSAILEALEKSREDSKRTKKIRGIRKHNWISKRMASFLAGCAFLMISAGYFTYLNAPEISVRITAVQSGIDAVSPQYVAQGYSMKGMAFFDGEAVNLKFSNGNKSYTLKQAETKWDSVALLENYVYKKWDYDYSTYQEKGITIYKNSNNEAAWVNNGKIFTIDGSNSLSNEEIRKIATGLV